MQKLIDGIMYELTPVKVETLEKLQEQLLNLQTENERIRNLMEWRDGLSENMKQFVLDLPIVSEDELLMRIAEIKNNF